MGRTNPTYRTIVEQIEQDWQPYRRGLRIQHQESFDALMVGAKYYNDASGLQNDSNPMNMFFMSALLHLEHSYRELEKEVEVLREQLESAEST